MQEADQTSGEVVLCEVTAPDITGVVAAHARVPVYAYDGEARARSGVLPGLLARRANTPLPSGVNRTTAASVLVARVACAVVVPPGASAPQGLCLRRHAVVCGASAQVEAALAGRPAHPVAACGDYVAVKAV